MAILSEINIYPIKSCGGIRLAQADIGPLGLALDRHWMVVDGEGQFLTQRSHAQMACIVPRLEDGTMILEAPGMPPLPIGIGAQDGERVQVQVWKSSVPGLDQGRDVQQWLSDFLAHDARLVRFAPDAERRCSERWTGNHVATTQFSDGYPLLVTNTASLADLNGKLQAKGAPALPMNRFRPNIVIDGMEAFEEDFIDTITLGDAEDGIVLKLVKPCARCPVPGIDQVTGLRDAQWPHEPLDTLSTYRADPKVDGGITFGQNAIVIAGHGKWLQAGQACEWELNF